MIDIVCKLISKTISSDNIGNQINEITKIEVPIIKNEKIYQNEFYNANKQGLKPSLRIKISALNYNEENELEYMNKRYSIIRTDTSNIDEIVLICERKEGNG